MPVSSRFCLLFSLFSPVVYTSALCLYLNTVLICLFLYKEQQMGSKSINGPLLSSAVIFMITSLKSNKKTDLKDFSCRLRVLSSNLRFLFLLLLLPLINSVSLSSHPLLPLSPPPIISPFACPPQRAMMQQQRWTFAERRELYYGRAARYDQNLIYRHMSFQIQITIRILIHIFCKFNE